MEQIKGTLSGIASISATIGIPQEHETNPYEGAYEWTPSASTQTIEIGGLRAIQDITINPIPSNYGLITWNGSTLTVS